MGWHGETVKTTHQSAATQAADGTDAKVAGCTRIGFQISGTATSYTVLFQVSVDGTTFVPLTATAYDGAGTATQATQTGKTTWHAVLDGVAQKVRLRLDAVAGGNVTVVSMALRN